MVEIAYTTYARHSIADFWGVDFDLLNDATWLEQVLRDASEEAGASILGSDSHQFDPQGATAFVLLKESHVSIHTYPEHGECILDALTCGDTIDPENIIEYVREKLKPQEVFKKKLVRGIGDIDVE